MAADADADQLVWLSWLSLLTMAVVVMKCQGVGRRFRPSSTCGSSEQAYSEMKMGGALIVSGGEKVLGCC